MKDERNRHEREEFLSDESVIRDSRLTRLDAEIDFEDDSQRRKEWLEKESAAVNQLWI